MSAEHRKGTTTIAAGNVGSKVTDLLLLENEEVRMFKRARKLAEFGVKRKDETTTSMRLEAYPMNASSP